MVDIVRHGLFACDAASAAATALSRSACPALATLDVTISPVAGSDTVKLLRGQTRSKRERCHSAVIGLCLLLSAAPINILAARRVSMRASSQSGVC